MSLEREIRQTKFNLFWGAIFVLIGLGFGGYQGWAQAVSAKATGHVTQFEYDSHGHPSLVIAFTDAQGRARELRTIPCGAAKEPELPIGAEVPVLVPPDGFEPLLDEPGAGWYMLGVFGVLGGALMLWSWSDLRALTKATE